MIAGRGAPGDVRFNGSPRRTLRRRSPKLPQQAGDGRRAATCMAQICLFVPRFPEIGAAEADVRKAPALTTPSCARARGRRNALPKPPAFVNVLS